MKELKCSQFEVQLVPQVRYNHKKDLTEKIKAQLPETVKVYGGPINNSFGKVNEHKKVESDSDLKKTKKGKAH